MVLFCIDTVVLELGVQIVNEELVGIDGFDVLLDGGIEVEKVDNKREFGFMD